MATENSRGTPSYRAPELLMEFPTFSDRVDIWALGCMLYELAVRRKAFAGDWAVPEYSAGKSKLLMPFEASIDSYTRVALTNLAHQMLQIDSTIRPNAQELRKLFDILVNRGSNPAPIESDDPLFLKICQPLSGDEGVTDQRIMYPSQSLN